MGKLLDKVSGNIGPIFWVVLWAFWDDVLQFSLTSCFDQFWPIFLAFNHGIFQFTSPFFSNPRILSFGQFLANFGQFWPILTRFGQFFGLQSWNFSFYLRRVVEMHRCMLPHLPFILSSLCLSFLTKEF